jgi:hypothetical protein
LLAERARLLAALKSGRHAMPAFQYPPGAALGELRRGLDRLAAELEALGTEERLLAGRARELELEARLAEHVGDSTFLALAEERFPLPENASELTRLAQKLAQASSSAGEEALHFSDDTRDPHSLWSELERRIATEHLALRIEVVPGLASVAAVGDGVVRIRDGARLGKAAARRIALHEIHGHVLPRVRGVASGGVLAAGSAGGSEDEEGRAILLEERAGLLDAERRRDLGRRYLAAQCLRQGGGFIDTVELLMQLGAEPQDAIELSCRVHRGGGLGRELIYLAGHARVQSAFEFEPQLERFLENGRVSLEAARLLRSNSFELDDHRDVV